jgi:hypothetical protein
MLRIRPETARFMLIAGAFVGVQFVALLLSYAAVSVLDSVRAYAVGETSYARGQKDAVLSLYRYIRSGDERYYDAFLTALAVPMGDKIALDALDRPQSDRKAVFTIGGRSPRRWRIGAGVTN